MRRLSRFRWHAAPFVLGGLAFPTTLVVTPSFGRQVSSEVVNPRVARLSPIDFEELPRNYADESALPQPWKKLAHLNRYFDILPNAHSRVLLGQAGSDTGYINANFISGLDGHRPRYIATQGPTAATIADFWQMVWEQGSPVIVMLTGLFEGGRPKCDQYWPAELGPETEVQYGSYFVTVVSSTQVGSYRRSELRLRAQSAADDPGQYESRSIHHFWYNQWPDHGAPEEVGGVIDMLKDVRVHTHGSPDKPWVVHCSAGIGRTGTFIAIDMGERELSKAGHADVLRLIQTLRKDRGGMVQTYVQAEFVQRALVALAEDARPGAEL